MADHFSNIIWQIAVGLIIVGAISVPHYLGTDAIMYFKYMSPLP
jgi:hypothetical protein